MYTIEVIIKGQVACSASTADKSKAEALYARLTKDIVLNNLNSVITFNHG